VNEVGLWRHRALLTSFKSFFPFLYCSLLAENRKLENYIEIFHSPFRDKVVGMVFCELHFGKSVSSLEIEISLSMLGVQNERDHKAFSSLFCTWEKAFDDGFGLHK
jgi:hypothetical protein